MKNMVLFYDYVTVNKTESLTPPGVAEHFTNFE